MSRSPRIQKNGGVSISGPVGSIVGDVVGGHKFTYNGLDEESLLRLLESRGYLPNQVDRQLIIELAGRYKPDEAGDFDQAMRTLEKAVLKALEIVNDGDKKSDPDSFVNFVLADVADKTRAGEFDLSASVISGSVTELHKRLKQQESEYKRQTIVLLETGFKIDILRHDAVGAARQALKIAEINHPGDRPAWTTTFAEKYGELAGDGPFRSSLTGFVPDESDSGSFPLGIAVEMARLMRASAQTNSESGIACHKLGCALSSLGERQPRADYTALALKAFREAERHFRKSHDRSWWFTAQTCVGNALTRLGESEQGTQQLEAALKAYDIALNRCGPDEEPLTRAKILYNKTGALLMLYARQGDRNQLLKAEKASNYTLDVYTREQHKWDWAQAQQTHGNVLNFRGVAEKNGDFLHKGIEAACLAASFFDRLSHPIRWGVIMGNLSLYYWQLSELTPIFSEERTIYLKKAVVVSNEGLRECTRLRVPRFWAMGKTNLGIALSALAVFGNSTKAQQQRRLRAAISAFDKALSAHVHEPNPLDQAKIKTNRGIALLRLATREARLDLLEQAASELQDVLRVFEGNSEQYAMISKKALDWARHNIRSLKNGGMMMIDGLPAW
jgi:tetratricopeptide (TPR) repeat protein